MVKYIALLRGINVGGKRKILMADLKELFRSLKFADISTYIQSGNVLFSAEGTEDNITLADKIEHSISKKYGFDVPVIIRTLNEWMEVHDQNPFLKNKDVDIERLHLTFLKTSPPTENIEKVIAQKYPPDEFEIIGNHVFLYCAGKYSDSKLSNSFFENKLNVATTTRNWKTVQVLADLSK